MRHSLVSGTVVFMVLQCDTPTLRSSASVSLHFCPAPERRRQKTESGTLLHAGAC